MHSIGRKMQKLHAYFDVYLKNADKNITYYDMASTAFDHRKI